MTDWCTGWPDLNYGATCCREHDRAYAIGGTAEDRKRADDALFECVKRKRGAVMAWAMWCGVRVFGSRFWPDAAKPEELQFAFRDDDRSGFA